MKIKMSLGFLMKSIKLPRKMFKNAISVKLKMQDKSLEVIACVTKLER